MIVDINGYGVLIDDDDIDKVNQYTWHIEKDTLQKTGGYYFGCNVSVSSKCRQHFRLHRYIMGCTANDGVTIDHINQNTLDNRKSNLRKCTRKENSRNRKEPKNNTSGRLGVKWHAVNKKWIAVIRVNNIDIYLGSYTDKEKAIEIRRIAELKYFGEFARKDACIKGN